MTTLEMLNASAKEPGVKFYSVKGYGHYCKGCRFYTNHDSRDSSQFNYVMENSWEREKPKPLRGEIEFEIEFNRRGVMALEPAIAPIVRRAVTGDPENAEAVENKRFRIKGTVEEIV